MDCDKSNLPSMIVEINTQVAFFRDMLINVGHEKRDSAELRAQIRKTRRACLENLRMILPQVLKSDEITSSPNADNPQCVLLYYLTQLFLRELIRSYHLLKLFPMDMSNYFDGSAVAHIGQLLLCKLGNVSSDFHSEELCCIKKDSQEIASLLAEMRVFVPKQELYLERNDVLKDKNSSIWSAKRSRALYHNMGLLCCIRQQPNYL